MLLACFIFCVVCAFFAGRVSKELEADRCFYEFRTSRLALLEDTSRVELLIYQRDIADIDDVGADPVSRAWSEAYRAGWRAGHVTLLAECELCRSRVPAGAPLVEYDIKPK